LAPSSYLPWTQVQEGKFYRVAIHDKQFVAEPEQVAHLGEQATHYVEDPSSKVVSGHEQVGVFILFPAQVVQTFAFVEHAVH
jgi:hypothetical protein